MSLAIKNGLPRTALRFLTPAAVLAASTLSSGVASAASLQGNVQGWQQGTEPGNMSMSIYVPDNVADNAPILVALHYCGGTASAIFGAAQSGGVVSAADQQGFIILLPQTSRNCWDVGTDAALTNGGGSDTLSIVHQVEYVVEQYGGNADRVYAMGQSGGAMAVEGLLAVYPDVFKGGAEFSGVPAGCWADGNTTDGQWSNNCANGSVTHSAQEWGDIARAMYPDYTGKFRPRIQLWHSNPDSIINFQNHLEAVKQWTNVLGLAETPTETSNISVSGNPFTREEWKDECDMTVLDVMTETSGVHNTTATMTAQYTLDFLGLSAAGAGDVDPQAASECWIDGGGEGTGGSDAGVGGSDAGAGGNDAGVGGSAVGAGGSAVGAGGAVAGNGGAGTSAGGSGVSSGGAGTMTGGTAAVAAGGTGSPGAGGAGDPGVADDSDTESSGGCSWTASNTSRPVHGLALAGLFVAMFARRRSKRAARVS